MRVQIRSPPGHCKNSYFSGTLQETGQPPQYKGVITMDAGIEAQLEIDLREYRFVNSPLSPCVEEKEFFECRDKCILEEYENKFTCRFPYVPKDSKNPIPLCSSKLLKENETLASLNRMAEKIFLQVNLSACNCHRACRQLKFYIYPARDFTVGQDITDISLQLSKHGIPTVTERLYYNVVDLTCEIGGNLGLYIGWSLLSLFEFFYLLKKSKHKRKSFSKKLDPIYKKVIAVLQQEKQRKKKKFRQECLQNISVQKIFHFVITIICVAVFMVEVWTITAEYLSNPTVNIVEIKENFTITFPNVAVCTDGIPFVNLQNKYIKATKKLVEPDLIDLIGFDPNLKALDKLWKKNDADRQYFDIGNAIKDDSLELVRTKRIYTKMLPLGSCVQIEIGEVIFIGTSTIFAMAFQTNKKFPNGSTRAVYFNAVDEDIDFLTPVIVPIRKSILFAFTIVEVHYLNLPKRPCSPTLEAYKCRRQCIESEIPKLVPCRLPYMPQNNSLSDCNSTKFGREAETIYFDFISHPLPPECKCNRPCSKIIYKPIVIIELPSKGFIDGNFVNFFSNVIEVIAEIETYSFGSYLANIGSNLGLILGYSILTMFDSITNILNDIKKFLSCN